MNIEITEQQLNALSPEERTALERWLAKNEPPLSPVRAAQMFHLFLHGHDCREIQRQNQQFALGMIVHARVRDNWDHQREQHINALYLGVRQRLVQSQMEGIGFFSDMFAVVHKLNGDKFKKFLQSGNIADLEGVSMLPNSIKSLKEAWEAFMKMSGQDKQLPGAAAGGQPGPAPVTQPTIEAGAPKQVGSASESAHDMIKKMLAGRKAKT